MQSDTTKHLAAVPMFTSRRLERHELYHQKTCLWEFSQAEELTWMNLEPEMEMATHSSIFAWEIPWTEEPRGPQRLRHDGANTQQPQNQSAHTVSLAHWMTLRRCVCFLGLSFSLLHGRSRRYCIKQLSTINALGRNPFISLQEGVEEMSREKTWHMNIGSNRLGLG